MSAFTRKSHSFKCSSKLVRQTAAKRNTGPSALQDTESLDHVKRTSMCIGGQTLVDSIFYVTPTVYVSTINIFPNKCTSRCKVRNTYKNSYIFRHPSSIFRELQKCRSPPTNLGSVHNYKLN
jgi:hypothetical protein